MRFGKTIAGLLSLMLLIAACAQSSDGASASEDTTGSLTGSLRVSAIVAGTRTALPADMSVASYRLEATGPLGESVVPSPSASGVFALDGLSPGAWSVTVYGRDGSGDAFLSGSASITVVAGTQSSASVRLSPRFAGTGRLSLGITWPASITVDTLTVTAIKSGSAAETLSYYLEPASATCGPKALPAGSYVVSFALYAEGRKVSRVVTDTALVLGGKDTEASYALTAADFGAGSTVTYLANGAATGDVPIDANFYSPTDDALALGNDGALALPGYSFAGWNTESGGGGTAYAAGDAIDMAGGDVVLYATWTENAKYRVYYHGNGNDGAVEPPIDSMEYAEGETYSLADWDPGVFKKTGFCFAGWCASPSGVGPKHWPGVSLAMGAGDAHLYAIWSRIVEVMPAVEYFDNYAVTVTGAATAARGVAKNYSVGFDAAASEYRWTLDGVELAGEESSAVSVTFATAGTHSLTAYCSLASGITYSGSIRVWVTK